MGNGAETTELDSDGQAGAADAACLTEAVALDLGAAEVSKGDCCCCGGDGAQVGASLRASWSESCGCACPASHRSAWRRAAAWLMELRAWVCGCHSRMASSAIWRSSAARRHRVRASFLRFRSVDRLCLAAARRWWMKHRTGVHHHVLRPLMTHTKPHSDHE